MKLLKIDNNLGYFLDGADEFQPIDKIKKEGLLRLVDLILEKEETECDEYDGENIRTKLIRSSTRVYMMNFETSETGNKSS